MPVTSEKEWVHPVPVGMRLEIEKIAEGQWRARAICHGLSVTIEAASLVALSALVIRAWRDQRAGQHARL